jgi:hypothetical protein
VDASFMPEFGSLGGGIVVGPWFIGYDAEGCVRIPARLGNPAKWQPSVMGGVS